MLAATFESFGESHWNTRDGGRPTVPNNLAVVIYRDAVFSGVMAVRGPASDASRPRVAGGDVGCNHEEFSDSPRLTPGSRYLLWITDPFDEAQSGNTTPWLMAAWPISGDGQVTTPQEGTLAFKDIASIVAATPSGSRGGCSGGTCP